MHIFKPLEASTDPHNDWWDAADTRVRRNGHMHNFPIAECTSQDETATTTKSSGQDAAGYVKVEETVTFKATVTDIPDATRRLTLLFTLVII